MKLLLAVIVLFAVFSSGKGNHFPRVRVNGIEQFLNLRSYYKILDAFKYKDYDSLLPIYSTVTLRWQNDIPVQTILLPNKTTWLNQFLFYNRSIETYNVTAVNDRIDFCFLNVLTPYAACGVQQKTSFCGMAYYDFGLFVGERFTGDLAPMQAWFASDFGCDMEERRRDTRSNPLIGTTFGL